MIKKLQHFFSLALLGFSVIVSLSPSLVLAHELLPKEVVAYLKEHPDATPEELRAYAQSQNPELAKKFSNRSTQEILTIIKNPESTFLDNSWDFFTLGVKHILSGADHVLFVLSLLLVFISIWDIFKLASTFTVAHSITLILAGTGVLVLSPSIVEPLIALSIAVMALASVFLREVTFMKKVWGKILLVFLFGLFHGLGFAGLLKEIAIPKDKFLSSLLAFNLGIEAGQLLIITAALPLILCFKNRTWYLTVVRVVAIIISVIAFSWFIQRIVW